MGQPAQGASFLPPGTDLQRDHPDIAYWTGLPIAQLRARWRTPEGQALLQAWRTAGRGRAALADLTGGYYGHLDMRGAPLDGESLRQCDLSKIDFFGVSLAGADLYGANLSDSWLSKADLRGARLHFARMDTALLDDVTFDGATSFVGVNLSAVNFTLAAQLQDLAISQQRIADLERRSPTLAALLRVTCDYGRSFKLFFSWAGGVIVIFALLHWLLGSLSQPGLPRALYFSVVTFTTLGYGDILPVGAIGKLLAMLEAIAGTLMLGLLVAIVSRRVVGN